jgi:hypothetical protein
MKRNVQTREAATEKTQRPNGKQSEHDYANALPQVTARDTSVLEIAFHVKYHQFTSTMATATRTTHSTKPT